MAGGSYVKSYSHNSKMKDSMGGGSSYPKGSMKKKGMEYSRSAPAATSIKVGGIATHTIKKNMVESPTTTKHRLNKLL